MVVSGTVWWISWWIADHWFLLAFENGWGFDLPWWRATLIFLWLQMLIIFFGFRVYHSMQHWLFRCSVTHLTSRVRKHIHLQFSILISELQILMFAVNCTIIQLTGIFFLSLIYGHSAVQVFISVVNMWATLLAQTFWYVSCFLFGDFKHYSSFLFCDLKLSQQCWWRFKTVGCYIMQIDKYP